MPQRPTDEAAFRRWYAAHAQASGLNPDPDAPQQLYDYRAAFRAGAQPDASGHWPSQFKMAGHPNEVVGGFNTRTGARVPGTAQASEQELVRLGWDPATAQRLSTMPQQRQTEVISIGGREVTVPVGLTPAQIKALAKQMKSPAVEVGGPPTEFEDVMIGQHLVRAPVNATPAEIKALAAELKRNPPKEDTFVGGGKVTDTHRASEGALRDNAPVWQKALSGAWEAVNPFPTIGKVFTDPVGLVEDIGNAHLDQFKKAYEAEKRQRSEPLFGGMVPLSHMEAMGHLGAAMLPIVGPAAANAGETIGRGEIARGLGQAGGLLLGGKLVEAAPRVALKVVKGARAPSTKVAARNAAIATQDAAEATARQQWEADAWKDAAEYDANAQATRAADAAKAATHRAQYDASTQTTRAADAAKAATHKAQYDVKRSAHEAAQDGKLKAARDLHDAERAVYEADTQIKQDAARQRYDTQKAKYDAATDLEQRTRQAGHDARKGAYEGMTTTFPEPPVAGGFQEVAPTPRAPFQDFSTPGRAPFQDFVPPPRNPFADYVPPTPEFIEPYVPPTPSTIDPFVPQPSFVPPPREVFPEVRGLKTRGGELAWNAAKYGGGGLLGYNVWQSIRDSFLK